MSDRVLHGIALHLVIELAIFEHKFESSVGRWLLSFLESKLDHNQFGNRKGRSSTHTIISVLHTWMSCLDSGGSVCTVFVDFHKAFDLVNHNILYDKLKTYGIPDFLLQWFLSIKSSTESPC